MFIEGFIKTATAVVKPSPKKNPPDRRPDGKPTNNKQWEWKNDGNGSGDNTFIGGNA